LGHTVIKHEDVLVVSPLKQERVLHVALSSHVEPCLCSPQSEEKILGSTHSEVVKEDVAIPQFEEYPGRGTSQVPSRSNVVLGAMYVPGRSTGGAKSPELQA
jgi:hypothetical protein